MSHEMTATDKSMTHGAAWHGLSIEHPTTFKVEEGRKAALAWEAEESSGVYGIFGADGEERNLAEGFKILRRNDTHEFLGMHGAKHRTMTNQEHCRAAEQVAEITGMECTSIGTIFGGRKTYISLAACSMQDLGKGDTTRRFITLLSGFDGQTTFGVYDSDIRTVCWNTYSATLTGSVNLMKGRHTASLSFKVADFLQAMRKGEDLRATGAAKIAALQSKMVNRDTIRDLWSDIVTREYGAMVKEVKNGHDERRNDRIGSFLKFAAETFDAESAKFGANLWIAANAATKAIQHHRTLDLRGGSDARNWSLMAGDAASATEAAFEDALALV